MQKRIFHILALAGLAVAALLVDSLLNSLSIPLALMDLLFVPFSIALLGWGISSLWKRSRTGEKQIREAFTLKRWLLSALLALLFISVGIYLLILGIRNPLKLFTGVRIGPTHGYTLAVLSLVCITYSIYFLWSFTAAFLCRPGKEQRGRSGS